MTSEFGTSLKIKLSGESHGDWVSAEATGIPAGIKIDREALAAFMKRRQGGNLPFTTKRKEDDIPEFESGVTNSVTNGETLRVRIYNRNVRSSDYGFSDTPRPSHADYTAQVRYGKDIDLRGGGHFSARLTAPLCAIGGVLKQYLSARGIFIGSHLYSVGNTRDIPFDPAEVTSFDFEKVLSGDFPVLSPEAGRSMKAELAAAAGDGDSLGGITEIAVTGLPAGLGDPLFYGVENRISAAVFGLGGVRGIEFGTGFAATRMRGSEHNDPFRIRNGRIVTETNNCGGVMGGITDGMPLVFRVAFKPTASISKKQRTVSLSTLTDTEIEIKGRHDPCIAIRALPCVESITAAVICDMMISAYGALPTDGMKKI